MNKLNKYYKLLLFPTLSLLLYFFIDNSVKINSTLLMVQESKSAKGLGVLILINIGKWFLLLLLLLFGVLGIMMFFYRMIKDNDS